MDKIWRSTTRAALYFASLCLLIWVVFPEWKTVAAGLLLGLAASFMNALLLRRRVEFLGQAISSQGSRKVGMGLASRLAMVLLAAMVALKFPDRFHIVAVLSACFFMSFAALAAAYYHNKKDSSGKG